MCRVVCGRLCSTSNRSGGTLAEGVTAPIDETSSLSVGSASEVQANDVIDTVIDKPILVQVPTILPVKEKAKTTAVVDKKGSEVALAALIDELDGSKFIDIAMMNAAVAGVEAAGDVVRWASGQAISIIDVKLF